MRTILFEDDGIIVYAEGGKVIEATENQYFEAEDTEKNRKEYIEDAVNTVNTWKKGD